VTRVEAVCETHLHRGQRATTIARRAQIRAGVLACFILLLVPRRAAAEWQLKPFFGVTFGGETTLVDLDEAVGSANVAFGVSALLIGDFLGVEADVGFAPGFFQAGDRHLVVSSSATTFTGNVVIAAPRRLTQYTLRPYFVGGAGLIHAHSEDFFGSFPHTSTLPAMDFGGGLTGFLTNTFGVSWDVRYFRSFAGSETAVGTTFGREELSFWRANMGLAIRF
jgi:hypothetical protein